MRGVHVIGIEHLTLVQGVIIPLRYPLSNGSVIHEVYVSPPPPPLCITARSRCLYQYIAKLWSLDDWDDSNAVQKTRFTKHQIRVLVVALKIDATEWSYGIMPDATIALIATLCRLSWPRPLADLVDMFG
jgi:hypothetical protein